MVVDLARMKRRGGCLAEPVESLKNDLGSSGRGEKHNLRDEMLRERKAATMQTAGQPENAQEKLT